MPRARAPTLRGELARVRVPAPASAGSCRPAGGSTCSCAAALRMSCRSSALLDGHAHRLELGVHLDAGAALLAAEAGLLVAAEGHAGIDHGMAIHPHRAGLDLRYQPLYRAQVVRPDAGGQAVGGVVGPGGDLIEVIEALGDDHGTEDLLANDLHVGLHVHDHCRLDVVAFVRRRIAAGHDGRPLLSSRLQIAQHPVTLLLRYQWAHLRALIEAWPDHDGARGRAHALEDLIEDPALHEEARARHAHLAGVEKYRLSGTGSDRLRIDVRQHDHRGLAAELERDALQRRGGRDVDD